VKVSGTRQLNARLRAIKQTFKPAGRAWAEETVDLMRGAVPVKTGRLRKSFRVKNASQRKAVVVSAFGARFLEAGTSAHDEKPRKRKAMKFEAQRGTVFSKKVHHPATRKQPFLVPSAKEALDKNPMAAELIKLWNEAA